MPPFREHGAQQLEATRVDEGATIANPRMVIERLIGRVKLTYAWFDWPRSCSLDLFTCALRVAARLTNYSPLLGEGISSDSAARVPLESPAQPLPDDSQRNSQTF